MMVVDMDLKGPWSLDGLASCFAFSDWDGMFAYGLHTMPWSCGSFYVMYDLAAYVELGDSLDQFLYVNVFKNYAKLNFKEHLLLKKGDPLIPVASAFGGLGIYKIKSLNNCFYEGKTCEHTCLHKAMAEKGRGKFYINPSLILLSGHQGPPNSLQVFKETLKELGEQKRSKASNNSLTTCSYEKSSKKRLIGLALIHE